MDTQNSKSKSGIIKGIAWIVALALIGFIFWKWKGNDGSSIPAENQNSIVDTNAKKYKDGSYYAVGTYISPAGTEHVDITLVIKDDAVVSGIFKGEATHPTSMKMQGQFAVGFNSYVVGKKIDDLKVMAVNGSSLTPKGFMDALSKIKLEAMNS